MSDTAQLLKKYSIGLQIGSKTLQADDFTMSALDEEIKAYNTTNHLEGLDPDLNPRTLSQAKVQAFVSHLAQLPAEQLESMQDKAINLNYKQLRLTPTDPVGPEDLADYQLDFKISSSPFIRAKLKTDWNTDRAIQLKAKAAAQAKEFDKQIEQLEKDPGLQTETDGSLKNQLSQLKQVRYLLGTVWQSNLKMLSEASDSDAYAQELQEASDFVKRTQVMLGAGMPH